MPSSLIGKVGSLVGIGGNIASAFRDEPDQQFASRPPFRGTITTPGFTFGGGNLARRGTDAFSTGGFASSLAGVRSGLAGLRSNVAGLRPAISGGLAQAQELFGRGEALRGRISGLDTSLAGLQEDVRPGFGRLSESATRTIRGRASAAAGNLRESLSRRNVLGSSFANAQQASISRDFAELEEQTKAQAIVSEIEQTRAIVQDRAGLVELSGRLIELDQRSLQEQARFIALDLGATETELKGFQEEVVTIQTEMQAFRDQISREMQELGVATSFLSVVDQFLNGQASSQIQGAASKIGNSTGGPLKNRINAGLGGGGDGGPSDPGGQGGFGGPGAGSGEAQSGPR